ncbi:MAG: hypothetical protein K2M36_00730 [Clostridia bacterium]|nr:hypothetical protein [Clostridia bacterium]
MEEIVINRGKKKKYIFSEDKIIVQKRDKIKYDIPTKDIRIIYYCPKALVGSWIIAILFHTPHIFPFPPVSQIFQIHIRNQKRVIRLKIKDYEYKKISEAYKLPIQLIIEWFRSGI